YHVSQILSKLDVATREEAAAWRAEERRGWWARWPLWAKIAGALGLAAAGALAILGDAASSSEIEEQSTSDIRQLTVEEVYANVREAVARRGSILHSTLDRESANSGGIISQSASPFSRDELWIDGIHASLRFHDKIGFRFIMTGDEIYRSGGFSESSSSDKWDAISAG